MSMMFIRPASVNGIPNSIKIDRELFEIKSQVDLFAFVYPSNLESKPRSFKPI